MFKYMQKPAYDVSVMWRIALTNQSCLLQIAAALSAIGAICGKLMAVSAISIREILFTVGRVLLCAITGRGRAAKYVTYVAMLSDLLANKYVFVPTVAIATIGNAAEWNQGKFRQNYMAYVQTCCALFRFICPNSNVTKCSLNAYWMTGWKIFALKKQLQSLQ